MRGRAWRRGRCRCVAGVVLWLGWRRGFPGPHGLPGRHLCLPGWWVGLAGCREAMVDARGAGLCRVHRGLARPYLSREFSATEGECLTCSRLCTLGLCHENHSGPWEFLGLVHVQLKVRERKDSPKNQTTRRRLCAITGLWKAGEKDQRRRSLEVYSQHPSHQRHLGSAMELSRASQVVEATGASHGCRK